MERVAGSCLRRRIWRKQVQSADNPKTRPSRLAAGCEMRLDTAWRHRDTVATSIVTSDSVGPTNQRTALSRRRGNYRTSLKLNK
jgi:hypothetical protein